jgi:hypothetical protein
MAKKLSRGNTRADHQILRRKGPTEREREREREREKLYRSQTFNGPWAAESERLLI